MAPTVERLTRTAQKITRGIWITAGLTMAGSALTGALTFDQLNEFWGIGLATAFAVDVALWVVLTGDHALQALGLSSGPWGRIMRVGTAAMSGLLNCGYSILMHQPYLAVLHVILPLLLVGLTEYHQGVALAIAAAIESAEQDQLTRGQAARPTVSPTPVVDSVGPATHPTGGLSQNSVAFSEGAHLRGDIGARADLQQPLHLEVEPTTQTPLRLVSPVTPAVAPAPTARQSAQPAPVLPRPPRTTPPTASRSTTVTKSSRGGPVQAKAVRWLIRQHRKGIDLSTITPAALATGAGLKLDTCRRSLDSWRADALDACEVTA